MDITLRRPHGMTAASTHAEREAVWSTWLDMDTNPAEGISAVVDGICTILASIYGEAFAEEHFAPLYDRDHLLWETDLGSKLLGVSAYAIFGLYPSDWGGDVKTGLEEVILRAENIMRLCPDEQWESGAGYLPEIIRLARARMNLDAGASVDPEALAYFGDVKMSRIRNMMSGSTPDLPRDARGWVLNEPAKAWLSKRDAFMPTLPLTATKTAAEAPEVVDAVFVPVARDGSVFGEDARRDGLFHIGDKHEAREFADFDAALAALQAMPVAKWRRMTMNGTFGLVAAKEWRRVDRKHLALLQA